ncbi:tripartite tricarboxylate transporter TctB family protein [Saxibacter everestensis]|uniref:Tripartite tricarboxylate transporter TctB family protein n=1 Tax=Saxibacter everestensis TaxID=2909229 RepID=A0ABY8QWA4_9MICO|nr:tripartite tricarboxylate transporter TctB family protein [Brevibacteriaceae bacterium ZFBP1038]
MSKIVVGTITANIVVIAIGVAAVIAGVGYGIFADNGQIGAGFLPVFAGSLMTVFAALDLVTTWRGGGGTLEELAAERLGLPTDAALAPAAARTAAAGRATEPAVGSAAAATSEGTAGPAAGGATEPAEQEASTGIGEVDIFGRSQRRRNQILLIVVGATVITVLLVPLLGFIVSFALMLFGISFLVERQKLLTSIIVTVVALAAIYGIFVILLRVPLPQGIFGF